MKKIIKILMKFFLFTLIVLTMFILGTFTWHKIASNKEEKRFSPPGEMVEVNGHNMHEYLEGSSNITLVFMAGHGTASPLYDFKPLWSKLTDKYKVAIVEKAGYGYSDNSDTSRDIDTILDETRQALKLTGINLDDGVVLVPHSMSGLEAIRWAQKYSDEVEAIIGLDMAVPETYNQMDSSQRKSSVNLVKFIQRSGLIRLIPSAFESQELIKSNLIAKDEIKAYRALFYRKTLTDDMLEEIERLKDNNEIIKNDELPVDTPMYFFISNGEEVGLEGWNTILKDYLSHINDSKYMELNSGHYVHHYESPLIANELKSYIEEILNED